jgi:hypothetical protein
MVRKRSNIAGGLILILLGVLFILWRIYPQAAANFFGEEFTWPWYIIGVGVIFLIVALATGIGGFAIPGTIIGGIGGLLYYQNATGDWVSWAYLWTLIPGMVGLGIWFASFLDPGSRGERRTGATMFVISVVVAGLLWAAFHTNVVPASFVWPGILILLGLYLLLSALFRRRA